MELTHIIELPFCLFFIFIFFFFYKTCMQLWITLCHAALLVWPQNWMAQKRWGGVIPMHLHSLQLFAHIQNSQGVSRPRMDKVTANWNRGRKGWFSSPKKVKYFALKNQALCLHQSQTNVNENLIKILVSAEYFYWNFQWIFKQLIPCSTQDRQGCLKWHISQRPEYSSKCHMLIPTIAW